MSIMSYVPFAQEFGLLHIAVPDEVLVVLNMLPLSEHVCLALESAVISYHRFAFQAIKISQR